MLQQRIYASAIGVAAVLVIGTVLLPWVDLSPLGLGGSATWNGLGDTGNTTFAEAGAGPHAYGWWVIAAAAIAIVAALGLVVPTISTRVSIWALWLAAACSAAALTVPIVSLVNPDWLIGDFFTEIGAEDIVEELGRDFLNVPVLGFVIGALVLLALLCAGTAVSRSAD